MPEKWALLIVDMLNDFIREGASLEVPAARNIVNNIRRRLQKTRDRGMPVIYICDAHTPDDAEFNIWPPHAVRGTEGAQVIDELAPQEEDAVVYKTTYAGFYGTDLDDELRKREITHIVLTGVVTNICILYIAFEAVVRGYQVQVPENCVATLSPEDHQWALKQMETVLNVEIM